MCFQTSVEPTWGMLATVGKKPVQASGQITVEVRTLDSLSEVGGPATAGSDQDGH